MHIEGISIIIAETEFWIYFAVAQYGAVYRHGAA
jgi:hypothetical protein